MKNKDKSPRKLTEKEIRRAGIIDEMTKEREAEGYVREDVTIGIIFANIMAFVLGIPIIVIFTILFFVVNSQGEWQPFSPLPYVLTMIAYIVSIFIHEGLHGLGWGMFAKKRWKSIEFGFMKEYLTPYCTCMEPLTKGQYFIGAFLPGLVLGIIPMAIAVAIGSGFLLFYGILMTFSAGGDFTILLKLFTKRFKGYNEIVYLDHPTECGYIVFKK